MKIYTYYEDINFNTQNKLIELWELSWRRKGFEPIVLNHQDAKKHPYYAEYNDLIRNISTEIMRKDIGNYGMSCWHRWLAYATQPDEKFYVSDYDAINVNFKAKEPSDWLHLMDLACPFFASGRPSQFESLCRAFVEVSNQRVDIIKAQTNRYHDQEFFVYNLSQDNNEFAEELKKKYNILMTRDRREIGGIFDPVKNKILAGNDLGYIDYNNQYGVLHVSRYSVGQLKRKYKQYNGHLDDVRIDVIKKLLNIK